MSARRLVGQISSSVGGGRTTPETAYFNGDGATLVFTIDTPKKIAIQSVFVGGQRYKEGVDYTKDDVLKKVTFLGAAVPLNVGIDVEYFKNASARQPSNVSNLSAAQLAQLANDLAPYLV